MLEVTLVIAGGVSAAIALALAFAFKPSRIRGTWRGGVFVTVAELARRYENALTGLVFLAIVVPRIEDPAEDPELMTAVKSNLCRGIPYIFLVSQDRFVLEQDGYYNVFRMYARDAVEQRGVRDPVKLRREVDRLVRIVPLKKNWTRHPYIFYHCRVGNDQYSIAFRGTERGQGIAKGYVTVSIEEAAAIYDGILDAVDPAYAHIVRDDLLTATAAEFEAAPARPERTLRVVRNAASHPGTNSA